jgi:tetratricopeptide (TPR) repeat protein
VKLYGGTLATLVLCVAACGGAGDRERLGDRAYGEGRYAQALIEYQQVLADDPDARIWAKAGAAALRTSDLEVASDAYLRLAAEDPTRAEEAA